MLLALPAVVEAEDPGLGGHRALVDGREELVDETAQAPADVRNYIAAELRALLANPHF